MAENTPAPVASVDYNPISAAVDAIAESLLDCFKASPDLEPWAMRNVADYVLGMARVRAEAGDARFGD